MVPVATLLGAQHYKASTGFSSLTNHASLASHNEQKKKKKKKKSLIIINVCIDRRTEWKTGIRAKFVILLKIYIEIIIINIIRKKSEYFQKELGV